MKRMILYVNGIVQGVGFRPFIHKIVNRYSLKGWVKNTSHGVIIEVEGNVDNLTIFKAEIINNPPQLALIEKVECELYEDLKGYKDFKIIESTADKEKFTLISPDVAICDDCLRELFDKNDRRYRFPFINCTNCGPRFTIIKDVPYDREKTTMADFKMCSSCSGEYRDISDRRYHAQPDCCFECGPKLFFLDEEGREIPKDPIELSISYLSSGKIIAVKGIGGFHLCCDPKNKEAVAELRKRKHREEKPFALMAKDIETVKKYVLLDENCEKLLKSYQRPIVLLKKIKDELEGVSPDNNYVGIMLPYTPIHHLLFTGDLDILIMTSANISDLPVIYENDDAVLKLKGIADGFLMNNRDIHIRCDDSLMMVFDGLEYPIRRSRGFVPFPIKVYINEEGILALGAEQKASFAISKNNYAFISQHIGDLKNFETLMHYSESIEHFKKLFDIKVKKLVCDLHPEYMSTEFAIEYSKKNKLPLYFIQHHFAHMASCMADNNINEDVIGIIWDGTGYGEDGTIWGGEFLVGNYKGYKRLGSIKPIPLVGGDKAIKDIYKIGYALIFNTLGEIKDEYIKTNDGKIIEGMLKKNINCPLASSIGRLFDGVSSILNILDRAGYEGQGAIRLESIGKTTDESYPFNINKKDGMYVFDWEPMIKEILKENDRGIAASKFMNTLIEMSVKIVKSIGRDTKLNKVVLSGGVFQNLYLLEGIKRRLTIEGFNVFNHKRVSTNDEGVSLGQLMIAANGGGNYVSCSTL